MAMMICLENKITTAAARQIKRLLPTTPEIKTCLQG